MERIPLTGEVMYESSDVLKFSGRIQYLNSTDFSLIYKAAGKYNEQSVSGIMIEFFPDDTADMFYDIARGTDGKIDIGKLSVKPFNKGKLRFRNYYKTIAEKAEFKDNGLIFFEENNTVYVFVNDDIKTEENTSRDILKFVFSVCKNAAVLSDHGFQVSYGEYMTGSSGEVFPAGPFILSDNEENVIQKNILNFGLMFFRLIFGRDATTFDRRMHATRKRSDMTLVENISDEKFDVVCNVINKTIQHNRDNCFGSFAEIMNEFEKLM